MKSGDIGYAIIRWILGATIIFIFIFGVLPNLNFTTPQAYPISTEQEQIILDGQPIPQESVDFTTWEQLGADGLLIHYNVDVYIPTGHAWLKHGAKDAQDALKSVTNNGTEMILSQNDNANLQLLTKNERGEEFVVIISRIHKSNDPYKNNSAVLKTAWKLVDGATIGSYYQENVINAQRCVLIRLRFSPGEVYFMPYR